MVFRHLETTTDNSQRLILHLPRIFVGPIYSESEPDCDMAVVSPVVMMVVSYFVMTRVAVRSLVVGPSFWVVGP